MKTKIKKILLSILIAAITVTAIPGCNLIFEPATDAIDRLMTSMPTGDPRVVREFCDGPDTCDKLTRLYGIIKSNWYNAKQGFYTIKKIEITEDTGRSFVYVDLYLPDSTAYTPVYHELVFEMERVKLRWHIYKVKHIDEFLYQADQARGIL